MLIWFELDLTNHEQCFIFGGKKSSLLKMNTGVPQGLVLGPFHVIT